MTAGESVTVSYDASTTNPIRDEAENDAAGLSNQAVVNNTPGVLLSESALTIDEGGSGTYTVRLAALPSADVTVAITSDNSEVTIDDTDLNTNGVQNTLTFTGGETGNWSHAADGDGAARRTDDRHGPTTRATLTHTD